MFTFSAAETAGAASPIMAATANILIVFFIDVSLHLVSMRRTARSRTTFHTSSGKRVKRFGSLNGTAMKPLGGHSCGQLMRPD
jgi:hypothetical protein